jgi:hypothetical protein
MPRFKGAAEVFGMPIKDELAVGGNQVLPGLIHDS